MKYKIIKTIDYYKLEVVSYSTPIYYGSRKIVEMPRKYEYHIKSKINESFLETDYQIKVGDIVENAIVTKININKNYIELYCTEKIYIKDNLDEIIIECYKEGYNENSES